MEHRKDLVQDENSLRHRVSQLSHLLESERGVRELLEKKVAAIEEILSTLVMFTGLELEFGEWDERRKQRSADEPRRDCG